MRTFSRIIFYYYVMSSIYLIHFATAAIETKTVDGPDISIYEMMEGNILSFSNKLFVKARWAELKNLTG